ncbi:DUF6636 domain-containing protein [Hyphomicrobium sp. D-2]|uniref:DUF6636 domain-containing protein n=1 Tax=Hyphomicrobium sp. D-2 TaxID=3041621 RepID=UPI0024545454|nr:DUF6636 domain-containing protein [Hyphomicrobium sp. D-2]MDH4982868.1 hypothetical protein [Hyphomicrobium sp. D-2]
MSLLSQKNMLAIAFLLALGAGLQAQELSGFQAPSGNIHCMLEVLGDVPGEPAVLRCDVLQISNQPPRRPADCDGEWGRAFHVIAGAGSGLSCVGDTVRNDDWPVLRYGEMWQQAGFTCRSEQTGITCANGNLRGFVLSRAKQTLF